MNSFAGAAIGIVAPSSSSSSGRYTYVYKSETNFPYRYSSETEYLENKQIPRSIPENAIKTDSFGLEYIPSLFMYQKTTEIDEYLSQLFNTLSEEKKIQAFVAMDKLHIANISQKQSEWWTKTLQKYGEQIEPCLLVYRILLMRTREQKYAENIIAYLNRHLPFVSIAEFSQSVKCIEKYGEITQKCTEYRFKLTELQKHFTKDDYF